MYNTIYPAYIRPYQGLQQKQITRKQDDEKSSQSSKQTENNPEQERKQSNTHAYFPNGEKVAIDYTRRQIDIEQVLKDFKNTTNTIGAPDEIKDEEGNYTEEAFYDYQLGQMENVKETVKYTVTFYLTKKDKEWQIDDLSESTKQKIHGIYIY